VVEVVHLLVVSRQEQVLLAELVDVDFQLNPHKMLNSFLKILKK
jgi:hypothetical protein